MTSSIRKPLVAATLALSLAVAGCGGTQASTATSSAAGTPAAVAAGPGAPSAAQLAPLAKALGVTTAKLQAAMTANRPEQGGAPSTGSATPSSAAGTTTSTS